MIKQYENTMDPFTKFGVMFGILHDKSKVVYTLLILCFGSEIRNWGKHKKDVDALPNFKFRISSFDIGIQFDNTRFFEKSVNW